MNDSINNSGADYVTQVVNDPRAVSAADWNGLLDATPGGACDGPFMRHEYLCALHTSGSATPDTGWTPHWVLLWHGHQLAAAAPLYAKTHSYGEYVFDWAWARAYADHGLDYYPKGLVAVPFTPVPGPRLLALNETARQALVTAIQQQAIAQDWSSVHLLFAAEADMRSTAQAGWMPRQTVQFHWQNRHPSEGGRPFRDFEDLLASLSQEKRKKIRQERRKVSEAGILCSQRRGHEITPDDWAFFYACYAQTYRAHGNAPYLSPDFFASMAEHLAPYWLMTVAHTASGERVGCSLVALSDPSAHPKAAFGRYWGAIAPVDCLHFEACYYQPLQWCIEHGVERFEGGAQGEHKMARALMPTRTHSAHWLAHPAFADAVDRFLQREGDGMEHYLTHLNERSPFRQGV
jgi:hypothetical protein